MSILNPKVAQTYNFVVNLFILTSSNTWKCVSEVFSPDFEIHSALFSKKANKKKKNHLKRKLKDIKKDNCCEPKKRKCSDEEYSPIHSPVSVVPDDNKKPCILPYKYYQIDSKGNVVWYSIISSYDEM